MAVAPSWMLDTIRKSLMMVPADRRWWWLVIPALAALTGAAEAGAAAAVFAFIKVIDDPGAAAGIPIVGRVVTWLPWKDPEHVVMALALLIALYHVLKNLFIVGTQYVRHKIVGESSAALAFTMLRGYLLAPYPFHFRRHSAELMRNVTHSVSAVLAALNAAATCLSEAVVGIGIVAVLVATSPLGTMAAAVGLGLVMVVLLRWTRGLAERSGRGAHDLGKEILRTLQHALGAIKEIKALGREGFFYRTFADKQRELLSLGYLGVTLQTIPPVLVETVFVCGALILIGVLALGGHVGADALPLLGLLGYAGLRLMPMANRLTWQVNQVRAARAAVNDLYDDYRLVTGGGWGNDGHAATTLTLHDRITVDRVSYTYPNAPAPALRDVTLTVARGEAVGFVGPTGAGKSTLVDVMIGLLSPTDGRVTVDGTDLAAGDPRRWHRHVGYVPQSIYLIDASVRENVALGIAPAEIDERRVREAIRIAQLDEVIARLPDGLDAVLGERGVLLSGGERQRVGIARALYHDPDLLVLDEATAALDLATERAVTQAIRALHGHKTVLVIAHRLSTVRSCDRIGLIVGGRLREWGTYDELLSRSDEFRALAVPTETEPSTSAASSSPMRRS